MKKSSFIVLFLALGMATALGQKHHPDAFLAKVKKCNHYLETTNTYQDSTGINDRVTEYSKPVKESFYWYGIQFVETDVTKKTPPDWPL